mgnify:CR=1 FL=1
MKIGVLGAGQLGRMLAQAGAMVGGQAVKDMTQLQITQGMEPLDAGPAIGRI